MADENTSMKVKFFHIQDDLFERMEHKNPKCFYFLTESGRLFLGPEELTNQRIDIDVIDCGESDIKAGG